MSNRNGFRRGQVGSADRAQRLIIGLLLLGLNAIGLVRDPDWVRWASLAVQLELIITAVVGWCPILWSFGTHSCVIRRPPAASDRDEPSSS